MTVRYTDKAARDLENLPRKDRRRILDALDRFAASGVGDARALGGRWRGRFRLRVGDWRSIFRVEGEIVVIRVSHRRALLEAIRAQPEIVLDRSPADVLREERESR